VVDLENLRKLDEMGQREYRDAWAWVHFMLHGPFEARQALVEHLSDLERQVPPVPLSQRLGQHLPNLERQFTEHFRAWSR
jgi:hypothetical protein